MRSAYLQCVGGVSGDMLLGAVIDAGVQVDHLNSAISTLGLSGVRIVAEQDRRGGVHGTHAIVEVENTSCHSYRLEDFIRITESSSLPASVKERSSAVFRRLREAEQQVHRQAGEEPHLGELGSVDTIVDVVCAVVGLETLGIERIYCSPLPSGSGIIKTSHGILPVPAPATSALFGLAHAPVQPPPGNIPDAGEMVTPTGAAIVTTLASFSQPSLSVEETGYGLGTRDPESYPNVVVLRIGRELDRPRTATLSLLETNIDDSTPEVLAYAQERLFEIGARDVWFTPIQMKKNRPGTMLSALVPTDLETAAARLILRETSTLGVRVRPVSRYEADRRIVTLKTTLGQVSVKVKLIDGANVSVAPEYEDCRKIALDKDLPLQDVLRIVRREAEKALLPHG
ncbi:MAG: nickel pincer cofactor biosynthesis protein LarC [Chloroflexi bacterium]|nr:nickel pincer cofactor biosynthesis protein LarC [Chloroflexota bacterium]